MSASGLALSAGDELDDAHCGPGQEEGGECQCGRFVGTMLSEQEEIGTKRLDSQEGGKNYFTDHNSKGQQGSA